MSHRTPVVKWITENQETLPKGKILEFGSGAEWEFRQWFESNGFEWEGYTKGLDDPTHKLTGGLIEDYVPKFQERYDLVFGCHVFEHVEKPIHALRNIKEYLKQNGMIVLATPIPARDQILEGSDADHIFVLNEWQMEKLLRFTGFRDIKVFRTGEHTRQDSIVSIGVK